MKDDTRAIRRHQLNRVKKNRVVRLDRWKKERGVSAREKGMLANTACQCSCHMCGNPRKHWNASTLQELKFVDIEKEI